MIKSNNTQRFGIAIGISLLSLLLVGNAGAVATITVCASGCDYSSIQEAIDSASESDTIKVYSGTYFEYGTQISVNKKITLMGVDTGDGRPILDCQNEGMGYTIGFSADGIKLEGFIIHGNYYGGISISSNDNIVKDNIIKRKCITGL